MDPFPRQSPHTPLATLGAWEGALLSFSLFQTMVSFPLRAPPPELRGGLLIFTPLHCSDRYYEHWGFCALFHSAFM